MAQDPWAEFEDVRPVAAQPRGAPRPVIALPNVDQQADNARADRGQANSDAQTNLAIGKDTRDVQDTAFRQTLDLRKAYESAPEVKNYRVVIPQLMDALNAPDDASGDNALLYAYAKIMDPASVVRESETESAASGASVVDQTFANLKKQFGIDGGGQLSPQIRAGLKRQALARTQQYGVTYRAQRQRYMADADAFQIDPARVIGPDDFEPYLPQFQEWQAKQGKAKDPTNADIYKNGVAFGDDGLNPYDGGPFDRERYLKDNFGITNDMEARIAAFWSRNSGNPNLTPEAVAGWYQQNGIPVPDAGQLNQSITTARKLAPGTEWGTIDTSAAEKDYRDRLRSDLDKQGFDPTSGGAYGARAVRGAEMGLSDEIEGIGGGISALFNNQGVADGYRLSRDRTREAYSQMEAQQGGWGTAAELGGGLVGALAIPSGAARGVAAMARQGAAQGTVAGFGYGEGLGGSVAGAATGAAIGAGGGAAFGKGGEWLANRRLGPEVTNRLYSERILGPEYKPGDALPKYGYRNVSGPNEVQSIIDDGFMLPPDGKASKYFTMTDREAPAPANIGAGKPILRVRSENIPSGRPVKSRDVEIWDEQASIWRPLAPSKSSSAQNYAAGQRFGIDLSVGDAGGMSPKIAERILDVQPGAGSVMNAERQRVAGQINDAVGDVAGSFGERTTYDGIGSAAQAGARNWMDKFQAVAGKVYDAIPIKPKIEATADNTRTALTKITRGFESNPELGKLWAGYPQLRSTLEALTPNDVSGIGAQELTAATREVAAIRQAGQERLSGLQDAFGQAQSEYNRLLSSGMPDARAVAGARARVESLQQQVAAEADAINGQIANAESKVSQATQKAYSQPEGGQVSWEDIKRLRSTVGQIIGKPSLNSDGATDKAMRGFYEALSRDMETTAAAQGPAALKAFQRANSLYREGQARIDGALTKLLGKKDDLTPQKAAGVIQTIARDGKSSGDIATLAEIRKTLKPEEWGQVSSGLIELLGQPANVAGREFNPQTFIQNFKGMAPEAKNLLFGGEGKALRQNLDEFVNVMGLVAKNNSTRNTSNTAMGLAGLAGYGAGGALGMVAQAATSFGAAKLWTNPAFVRWATGFSKMEAAAARTGNVNQGAFESQMKALTRIAANDNVIAADVQALQSELMGWLGQSRSAATPPIGVPQGSAQSEEKPPRGANR